MKAQNNVTVQDENGNSSKPLLANRFNYVNDLLDVMKFGKYKGLTIKEVILKDYQYINYIQKKIGFNVTLDCILLINDCKDDEGISEGYFSEYVENVC